MKIELPPLNTLVLWFVLFVSAVNVVNSVYQRLLIRKQQKKRYLKIERPKSHFAYPVLYTQIILLVFFTISYNMGWDFLSVGLKFTIFPLASLIVGIICYIIFVLGLNKIFKLLKVSEVLEDETYRVLVRLMPRHKLQKILLLIAICLLNPITEELMFRGILVHQLGIYINNHWLAIAIGLFVNIGNHIYQGKLQITTHITFYLIVVALLYSPVGLLGAIGFHFCGDIYPFMSLKHDVINYKKRRRSKRISNLNRRQ
ncbi:hypothetical protein CAL7716_103480 (plasmid) [Calothrix sp. PCC 7716]|nr:hypothetical protein CAL7716_103480 [Calothrix sp. PCC 7716]